MRSPSWALLALLAVLAVGNLWVTLTRSTIPLAIEGQVTDVELRFEKRRGVDDVYLVTVADRVLHVDTAIGRRIRTGDRLSKDAWSRTLSTPRGPVRLTPSRDARRMAAVMPLIGLAGVFLLLRAYRRADEVTTRG